MFMRADKSKCWSHADILIGEAASTFIVLLLNMFQTQIDQWNTQVVHALAWSRMFAEYLGNCMGTNNPPLSRSSTSLEHSIQVPVVDSKEWRCTR